MKALSVRQPYASEVLSGGDAAAARQASMLGLLGGRFLPDGRRHEGSLLG